ncbi:MAG: hypothetical protein ACXVZX_16625, partial [Terriglobales bacterium]
MLSKCANPACSRPFRYLRDGKIFEIDSTHNNGVEAGEKKTARRVEFYWLCGDCSAELTIIDDHEKGVITVPIPQARKFLV